MRAAVLCLVLVIWVVVGLTACGSGEEQTPAACLRSGPAYADALAQAPGEVRIGDGVAISDCLTKNQSAGDLSRVGVSMVSAATALNRRAQLPPGPRRPALEVGYLVGAATEGASDTGGIHANLIDRLTAAARFSPRGQALPQAFRRAYATGYAAGEDHG